MEVLFASVPIHLIAFGAVGFAGFVQDVVGAAKWCAAMIGHGSVGVVITADRTVVTDGRSATSRAIAPGVVLRDGWR